jgi:hypothetical protein
MTQTDKHDDKKDKPEPRLQRAKTWVMESWMGLLILSAVIVVIASAFLLPFLWRQAGSATWDGNATRNIALVIGGLIAIFGLVIAARRQATNQRQYELARKADFSETFAKGVNALASDSMTIKISGIRVFENLAKSLEADSDNYGMIVKTINDFIRESAAPPIDEKTGLQINFFDPSKWPISEPREKRQYIGVAIKVLAELTTKMADWEKIISLNSLDLRDLYLTKLDLEGASLDRSNLDFTKLNHSNLARANFTLTSLTESHFEHTRLDDATFIAANLSGARFKGAFLTGADYQGSDLFKIKNAAHASKEKLETSNTKYLRQLLDHADFTGADVTDADFSHTTAIEDAFTDEQLNSMRAKPKVLNRQQVLELIEKRIKTTNKKNRPKP